MAIFVANSHQNEKEFNITGICYPEFHYMMDNSSKLQDVFELIERGKYFTINRPRQYGKTTTLFMLTEKLKKKGEYLPIKMNFQRIDEKWHESDADFARMFCDELRKSLVFDEPDLADFLENKQSSIKDMNTLSAVITKFVHEAQGKKLVLLIDEVDASSNYESFLNFLGMLRTKYLGRMRPRHATFYSIVLAGVHDIKSLKFKLRNPSETQYNSPWNIAVEFEVGMSFNPKEIAPMLEQYCEAENITMDISAIAEELHYQISGYPFLVSKLCKNIAEKILPNKPLEAQNQWKLVDVKKSVELLLKENNTNFDSLINNMENNPSLYKLTYEVIINGANIPFSPQEPVTRLGRIYGVFKANGRLKVHNRIYEQCLYNYMTGKTRQTLIEKGAYDFSTEFINPDNSLDLQRVLTHFQRFMKEQRSSQDKEFIERQWRLIFLAFLKPIIAGKGHDFKEVETSDEKRLDVVVTFYERKYILELKIWRGSKNHDRGLKQLANYLDIHSVSQGFLLIFDIRKKKTWEKKWIKVSGKDVFAVWL